MQLNANWKYVQVVHCAATVKVRYSRIEYPEQEDIYNSLEL